MTDDTFYLVRLEKEYIFSKKTIRGGVKTLEAPPMCGPYR
jgi:hypothetical protein